MTAPTARQRPLQRSTRALRLGACPPPAPTHSPQVCLPLQRRNTRMRRSDDTSLARRSAARTRCHVRHQTLLPFASSLHTVLPAEVYLLPCVRVFSCNLVFAFSGFAVISRVLVTQSRCSSPDAYVTSFTAAAVTLWNQSCKYFLASL